jgi:desulfoferrodoxin (superoxide reductase-like protein)
MKTRKLGVGFIGLIFFFMLTAGMAFANKSAVKIEAPDEAVKGAEVTVKLHVTHSANNFIHHTKWLKVQANGKEIARWDYSMFHLPEGANFTKEIKVPVNEDLEIVGEASCNIHESEHPDIGQHIRLTDKAVFYPGLCTPINDRGRPLFRRIIGHQDDDVKLGLCR